MCRWLAYSGSPVLIEDILFTPRHSLIDQSMSSRSRETPTNGDGFGVGWYGPREHPGLYRSIRPAWNDFNLRDLAAQVESRLFLAHVRATSCATVQETNCHPFRHGNWLFVHNGEIHEIEKFRRDLLIAVDPSLFCGILGTTDSELIFHLALTFGLQDDPIGAMQRTAGFIEQSARAHGVPESLWMTLGITDGRTLHAIRYASDGQAPTLHHSRDMDDLYAMEPKLREKLGPGTRIVVSEPIGKLAGAWMEIPQATAVTIRGAEIESRPFSPVAC